MRKILGLLLLLSVAALARPALAQIAPGVQQAAGQTATISGTVTLSDGTFVSGADVKLLGPVSLSTRTDAEGAFQFRSVLHGIYTIVTSAGSLGLASRTNIAVTGDISVKIQYSKQSTQLRTIAAVTTRAAGVHINLSPASIASVSPSQYAFQGNTSWKELLDQIPGVAVGGNLFGGATTTSAIPDDPFQPITLSINGALPYETSVTLDGMPLVNTSFAGGTSSAGNGVDLYSIPMAMFDDADVVRGPGANAPSIVDSIGGSFVLHAPGAVTRNIFELSAGNDLYGGLVANAKTALHFGRLSITMAYNLNDSSGPLGTRNEIPAFSFNPLTVDGQPFKGCSPTGGSCEATLANPTYQNCSCNVRDFLVYCCVGISTDWTEHAGAAALSYDISPSVSAQVFYAGSSARSHRPQQIFSVDFSPGPGYSGAIAPGMQSYYNTAGAPYDIGQASSLLEEKVTAYLGNGVLRLGALQDNSFSRFDIPNFYPAGGTYTLYGTGYYSSAPTTPVNFNGTTALLTFPSFGSHLVSWVNNRDLLISYATQVGTSSNIGLSYTNSFYNEPYLQKLVIGSFALSSGQPPDVSSRTGELRFFAGANLSRTLSVDGSWYLAQGAYHVKNPARPTQYTDPGFSYSAPRFGASWHVSPNLVLRGSAGGGYAVPPLSYFVGTNSPTVCFIVCTITVTNLALRPETGFSIDLGADARLSHDTVASLDLYRTNLYGQFFQSANLTGTYNGLPLYTTEYGNLPESRLEGVNFDLRHQPSHGMYWQASLGLTRGYVTSLQPGFYDSPGKSGPNSINTYVIPGINFDGQFQSTVPYANGTAQVGYRWSPGTYLDLSPTYYGKGNPYFEPAFVEFDAHAGHAITKNFSILATFRNITGIYGQEVQYYSPSMGAPTIAGQPYALFGVPYGPRAVIVTGNLKY